MHPRLRQPGFTLVELLISILMVVLLMLGVNQVFKMSSDTIGIGQTVSRQTRDLRSAAAVMADDCKRWAPDAPLFYIVSQRRNDGVRRDVIGFPARGSFRRHTANDGSFIADTSGLEAWVWYGHLDADIANVLGRVQLVMKDKDVIEKGNEDYIQKNGLAFSPLNPQSQARYNTSWVLANSRFDLIGTTIDGLRTIVENERPPQDNNPNHSWWRSAVDTTPVSNVIFRYQAKTIIPRPISSARMAQVAPVFVTDCEEFRVEFAGDYYEQDNDVGSNTYGKYLRPRPDGKIDYQVFGAGSNRREQVRWYGYPRETSGDALFKWQDDVCPVGTIRKSGTLQTTTSDDSNYPYFERDLLPVGPNVPGRYNVVLCNEAPRLIRVGLKLVDPAGRIQDGTWTEYILGPQ